MNHVKLCQDHIHYSKWPTYRHFCLLRLIIYLKILSVGMNISNTNECLFSINTCIFYNPLMNHVKFCQDQIQNVRLIAIFAWSNHQNIWKFCPSGWISPTSKNIFFWYFTHVLILILPNIPVKFRTDQIQNGHLNTIFVCSNWQQFI